MKGTLTVSHSLQEDRGHLRLKSTKTEASERTLPLPKFLAEELRAHAENFGSRPYTVATDDGEREVRFFFSGEDGAPLRKSWVRRHFRPAAVKAGIYDGPPTLRSHHCRHGYATMLFAAGMNIKQVQEWLGHKSPIVTMSTYVHAIPGDKESCANTLDNIHAAPADDNVRALLA